VLYERVVPLPKVGGVPREWPVRDLQGSASWGELTPSAGLPQ
jgi:hypothetical protein